MLPYWLLFSVFAVGAVASADDRRQNPNAGLLFVAAAAAVVLMIGLRYQVGGDWGAYLRMFQYMRFVELSGVFSIPGSEPAYSAISWISYQLGLGIWAVNLTCAAILTWGLLRLARHQPRPWLALVVAIPFLVIVVGMGYTRQSAALGLFMLGLALLIEKRLVWAVFVIIIGATFHTSALVTLPFVAFSYARNRLQMAALIVVAAIFGYFTLLAPQFDRLTYGYIEQEYQAQGAMIRLIMNAVPALIFFAWYRRFAGDDPIQKILWRNLSIIALGSFAAVFFTDATVALDRLALYIIPLQLVVLSRIPTALGATPSFRIVLTIVVMLYSALVQFTWLNYAHHADSWVPYRTVFASTGAFSS